MTARLSRPLLALLLALATLAVLPATSLAAAPAVPSRPAATASLPWAAVAFAAVHRDQAGHVDAALVGVVAVVVLPENRVKGQTDPRVLATLESASLAALSQLGKGCVYDGTAVGSPVYVNGDPVNLVDPTGHCTEYDSQGDPNTCWAQAQADGTNNCSDSCEQRNQQNAVTHEQHTQVTATKKAAASSGSSSPAPATCGYGCQAINQILNDSGPSYDNPVDAWYNQEIVPDSGTLAMIWFYRRLG